METIDQIKKQIEMDVISTALCGDIVMYLAGIVRVQDGYIGVIDIFGEACYDDFVEVIYRIRYDIAYWFRSENTLIFKIKNT